MENGAKLNKWDGSFVLQGGLVAQSLTSLDVDASTCDRLTPASNSGPLLPDNSEAIPTCAVALATAAGVTNKVFQLNRCMIEAPTQRELMFTKDKKRLYV